MITNRRMPNRNRAAALLAALAVVAIMVLVWAAPAVGQHRSPAPAPVGDVQPLDIGGPSVNLTPDDPGRMLTEPRLDTPAPAAVPLPVTPNAPAPATVPPAAQLVAAADDDPPVVDPPAPTTPAAPGEGVPNGPNGELGPTTPPPPPNPAEATNPVINP